MITDNSRQTLAQLFSMTPNNPLGEESRKDRDCNDEPMNPNNLLQYSSELMFIPPLTLIGYSGQPYIVNWFNLHKQTAALLATWSMLLWVKSFVKWDSGISSLLLPILENVLRISWDCIILILPAVRNFKLSFWMYLLVAMTPTTFANRGNGRCRRTWDTQAFPSIINAFLTDSGTRPVCISVLVLYIVTMTITMMLAMMMIR